MPVGEVHGTVNDTGAPARLISFQSPPDPALYAGQRDHTAGGLTAAARRPPQRGTPSSPWPRAAPPSASPATGAAWSQPPKAPATSASTTSACPHARNCPTRPPPLKRYSSCLPGPPTVQANDDRHPLARHGVVFLQHGDQFPAQHQGQAPSPCCAATPCRQP